MMTSCGILFGNIIEENNLSTELKKRIQWKIRNYGYCRHPTVYESEPFMFAGTSWCLQMTPPETINDYLEVCLKNRTIVDCKVKVSFSVMRYGRYETRVSPTPFEEGRSYPFLSAAFLNEKALAYVPVTDILVMACDLELIPQDVLQGKQFPTSEHLNLAGLEALSRNLKELFSNKDDCDVLLIVQGREIKAHRHILTARSPVFAAMFRHNTDEKKTRQVTIPDCDPEYFLEFLEYLYCGKLARICWNNVFLLYTIADKYNLPELMILCDNYIMQNLTVQNIYDVAAFAEEHNKTDLFALVQECFNNNLVEILKTSEWETLFKNNFPLATKLLTKMAKTKK